MKKSGWAYSLSGTQHFLVAGNPICGIKIQVSTLQDPQWFEEVKRCSKCEKLKPRMNP